MHFKSVHLRVPWQSVRITQAKFILCEGNKTSAPESTKSNQCIHAIGWFGPEQMSFQKKVTVKYDPQLRCLPSTILTLLYRTYTYFRKKVSWIIPNPVFNGFCTDRTTQEFLSCIKILPENKYRNFGCFPITFKHQKYKFYKHSKGP